MAAIRLITPIVNPNLGARTCWTPVAVLSLQVRLFDCW